MTLIRPLIVPLGSVPNSSAWTFAGPEKTANIYTPPRVPDWGDVAGAVSFLQYRDPEKNGAMQWEIARADIMAAVMQIAEQFP